MVRGKDDWLGVGGGEDVVGRDDEGRGLEVGLEGEG